MEVSGQLQDPDALSPGKKPLGGTRSRSGRFGDDKNLMPLPGFKLRIFQSVA